MSDAVIVPPGAVEVDDLDEIHEVLPTKFSITSFGADFPVDGLVKRLNTGDIVIPSYKKPPVEGQSTVGFQRDFVWDKWQADRFVESLLLGLPVPGIFLVKEPNEKHLVLDGQQRLSTLQSYVNGVLDGVEFKLAYVQPQWVGQTYKTLNADDRRRFDNSLIHATIVKQDEPSEDQTSIYLIFERLNSGGTSLQPQEIRVALYHGDFANLLSKLNDNADWRALYGKKSSRLKDIELLLRFLALYFHLGSYDRPMKAFLNRFMASNRNLAKHSEAEIRPLFEQTVAVIRQNIGAGAFRPSGSAINAAALDSLMYGVASRLASGKILSPDQLLNAHKTLLAAEKYLPAVLKATADKESVLARFSEAKNAFAGVK